MLKMLIQIDEVGRAYKITKLKDGIPCRLFLCF